MEIVNNDVGGSCQFVSAFSNWYFLLIPVTYIRVSYDICVYHLWFVCVFSLGYPSAPE